MLSLLPQLFTYRELAPFILRLIAGLIAINFAYPRLKSPKAYLNFAVGIAEFCAGAFLLAGFLTQLGAGLIIIAMLFEILKPVKIAENQASFFSPDKKMMIFLIAVSLSLMFLGPGFFSFDLPL